MNKYPQNQSSVGSNGQTLTTNVSITLCNWQTCHQTHVLCGCTAFGTESNQVPTQCGPYARGGLDKGVAFTKGGGGWHKASVCDCLPLAAPIGLSPLLILTLCGPECMLVVSTEPPDDLSCLTTPGVGRPEDGAVAGAVVQWHPDAHSESMRGFADSSTDLWGWGRGTIQ